MLVAMYLLLPSRQRLACASSRTGERQARALGVELDMATKRTLSISLVCVKTSTLLRFTSIQYTRLPSRTAEHCASHRE